MTGKERMTEIKEMATEYWGRQDVMLIKGYTILDTKLTVGECLEEGDVIDVIPDLAKL